jgi:hypothetical protein
MVALEALGDPSKSLCWVAPVAEGAELATEDPLALDYLAQQVGLSLLPTLTSRSARAQAFAMVLYGLHLVELAIRRYQVPATDEQRRALFERWERFWALATLEYRQGDLARSDGDAMRGVRGAKAAWRPGQAALSLDFPMISRQQELGNLGAYLSPLRRSGLVIDGTLRPSPAALELIDAFWDEADNKHRGRYDEYALVALDPARKTIERSHHKLTLAKVGEMSRLSSLVERQRTAQQRRLYELLFVRARDASTLPVSKLVEAAARRGVRDSQELLDAAIDGRLGAVEAGLAEQLVTAVRFGEVMDALLGAFDRIYSCLWAAGSVAPLAQVVSSALSPAALAQLRRVCAALLETPRLHELQRLPMHGGACVRLVHALATADATAALEALLRYHGEVQRERRRGKGWIERDGERLLLKVATYTSQPEAARFPPLKLPTVRSLLMDTGRLPRSSGSSGSEQEAS